MHTETSDWAARQKRNTQRLGAWTAAWVLTMAVATFGPTYIWAGDKLFSVIAIVVNLAVGAGMVFANKRHLLGLDEMQQRVHLEAMGITLGVGLVAGLGYSLLDITDVIAVDAEIAFLIILMSLTYLTALVTGMRRLR